MHGKYYSLKIPLGLAEKIAETAVQKQGTYRTVSEFVIESARRQLDVLEAKPT